MRLFFAGLLLLFIPTVALAQAKGEVESIGFNNAYRPDSWTPMVVRLRPETNDPGTYQIQVWQYDIDGDRPVYTRQITLNGADQAREQRFWMYFLPQPINKGLPDPTNGGTLKDLQHDLEVFLCSAKGVKITQLPITSTLQNIDPYRDYSQLPRGAKLILCISDGNSQPAFRDYQAAVGISEEVAVVNLTPRDLPEDPIGYEAVDSIVWLNSDPADLDKGGAHKLQALQDYVKFGGQLVICQPTTDWQKSLGFGDLLPVTVQGVASKDNLEPLRGMAKPQVADIFGRAWMPGIGLQVRFNLPGRRPSRVRWCNPGSTGKMTAHTATLRHTWFAVLMDWDRSPGWRKTSATPQSRERPQRGGLISGIKFSVGRMKRMFCRPIFLVTIRTCGCEQISIGRAGRSILAGS